MQSKQRFPDEANARFTYSSVDELLKNTDDLSEMIQNHQQTQVPRLKTLENYYKGNNETILTEKRRKEEHMADHRAAHNFAKYVSQFIQGYMVGVPLKTQHKDDKTNEILRGINRDNDADEHNSDLILDLSIYGRAYELLYRNQNDETRFTTLDPKETFVIYDDTVEMNPIAGVRYVKDQFKDYTDVYVYTDEKQIIYQMDTAFSLKKEDEKDHYFKGVPIIEYENNKFRQGDFEDVLNLIDLYDSAQSDTANYMTDLNDAFLKIVGNVDIDVEKAKDMKQNRIILLQTERDSDGRVGQADADYIYKQYDVSGTEAYKSRVEEDIHKFTNTPNMNDQNFAGNRSGEAMKYKLFGLEQVRVTKERLFKKSLRDRYRLINNIMQVAAEGGFDVNDISITFTPNLPKSLKDEIEIFVKLGGDLSDETKLSLLSVVENPLEELERIKKENPQAQAVSYDFPKKEDEQGEGEEDAEVSKKTGSG